MRRNEKVYKRRRIAVACVAAVVVLAAAVGLTLLLHPAPRFTFDGEKAATGTITGSSALNGTAGRSERSKAITKRYGAGQWDKPRCSRRQSQ